MLHTFSNGVGLCRHFSCRLSLHGRERLRSSDWDLKQAVKKQQAPTAEVVIEEIERVTDKSVVVTIIYRDEESVIYLQQKLAKGAYELRVGADKLQVSILIEKFHQQEYSENEKAPKKTIRLLKVPIRLLELDGYSNEKEATPVPEEHMLRNMLETKFGSVAALECCSCSPSSTDTSSSRVGSISGISIGSLSALSCDVLAKFHEASSAEAALAVLGHGDCIASKPKGGAGTGIGIGTGIATVSTGSGGFLIRAVADDSGYFDENRVRERVLWKGKYDATTTNIEEDKKEVTIVVHDCETALAAADDECSKAAILQHDSPEADNNLNYDELLHQIKAVKNECEAVRSLRDHLMFSCRRELPAQSDHGIAATTSAAAASGGKQFSHQHQSQVLVPACPVAQKYFYKYKAAELHDKELKKSMSVAREAVAQLVSEATVQLVGKREEMERKISEKIRLVEFAALKIAAAKTLDTTKSAIQACRNTCTRVSQYYPDDSGKDWMLVADKLLSRAETLSRTLSQVLGATASNSVNASVTAIGRLASALEKAERLVSQHTQEEGLCSVLDALEAFGVLQDFLEKARKDVRAFMIDTHNDKERKDDEDDHQGEQEESNKDVVSTDTNTTVDASPAPTRIDKSNSNNDKRNKSKKEEKDKGASPYSGYSATKEGIAAVQHLLQQGRDITQRFLATVLETEVSYFHTTTATTAAAAGGGSSNGDDCDDQQPPFALMLQAIREVASERELYMLAQSINSLLKYSKQLKEVETAAAAVKRKLTLSSSSSSGEQQQSEAEKKEQHDAADEDDSDNYQGLDNNGKQQRPPVAPAPSSAPVSASTPATISIHKLNLEKKLNALCESFLKETWHPYEYRISRISALFRSLVSLSSSSAATVATATVAATATTTATTTANNAFDATAMRGLENSIETCCDLFYEGVDNYERDQAHARVTAQREEDEEVAREKEEVAREKERKRRVIQQRIAELETRKSELLLIQKTAAATTGIVATTNATAAAHEGVDPQHDHAVDGDAAYGSTIAVIHHDLEVSAEDAATATNSNSNNSNSGAMRDRGRHRERSNNSNNSRSNRRAAATKRQARSRSRSRSRSYRDDSREESYSYDSGKRGKRYLANRWEYPKEEAEGWIEGEEYEEVRQHENNESNVHENEQQQRQTARIVTTTWGDYLVDIQLPVWRVIGADSSSTSSNNAPADDNTSILRSTAPKLLSVVGYSTVAKRNGKGGRAVSVNMNKLGNVFRRVIESTGEGEIRKTDIRRDETKQREDKKGEIRRTEKREGCGLHVVVRMDTDAGRNTEIKVLDPIQPGTEDFQDVSQPDYEQQKQTVTMTSSIQENTSTDTINISDGIIALSGIDKANSKGADVKTEMSLREKLLASKLRKVMKAKL